MRALCVSMINIHQAQQLIEAKISKGKNTCVVLEKETIEKYWGWVFFYQSKSYFETQDFRQMLAGNAPFIVNKETSVVSITGTSHPIEHYIKEYESSL
jgi:hypothetical protein